MYASSEAEQPPAPHPQHSRLRLLAPAIATLVLAAGVAVVLLVYDQPLAWMGDWGYPGAFLLMLVNNLTVLLPAVGNVFIAALAQTLNPWLLGVFGGIGAALGESSGYVVGHSGGRATGRRLYAWYQRKTGWRGKFMGPTLFMFAATPLPFDIAGIVAGAVHYPFSRFLAWVTAGKIINTTLLALASYYTIDWLNRFFSTD